MKKTYGLAAAVLLAASLTACGDDGGSSDSGAEYCDLLQDAKDEFQNFDSGDLKQATFEDLDARVGDLEAAAPDDVADDWKTIGDAIGGFLGVLEDAGVSLDDLAKIQAGEMPEGVDMQKLQEIGPKIEELGLNGPEFEDATTAIEKHAKSECDIDMNTDGSGG